MSPAWLFAGFAAWAGICWLNRWSNRKVADCQNRALAAWQARQCPDRLDDPRDIQLACHQVVEEAEQITREADT